MTRRVARVALFAAIALVACQHLPFGGGRIAECPGALRSVDEIRSNFRLDQRVWIRAPRAEVALRLAVEKRGSRLVLIGLNPLGAKVFTVIQEGSVVLVEALPAAVVEVPPVNILRDLHRIRFLGAEVPPDASGRAAVVRDGTRIAEEWRGGALQHRSFERVAGRPRGEVDLVFDGQTEGAGGRVRIENGWCDYSAVFETLSEEALP